MSADKTLLSASDLQELNDSETDIIVKILNLGGLESIAQKLGSDTKKGIIDSSEPAIQKRRIDYGANKVRHKLPTSLPKLFLSALSDSSILVLLVAAAISIIIGAVMCSVTRGKACPKIPLWGDYRTAPEQVIFPAFVLLFEYK
jgi:magnesium-transporting ATPase (P-type)